MGYVQKLKNFIGECKRVLAVTRKPTNQEFKTILKVTGLGTLAIGLVGFIIHVAWFLLLK